MKILQISAYPPDSLGGSEIFCRNLAINLKTHGIKSEILTSNYNSNPRKKRYFDKNGIKIINKTYFGNFLGINPVFNILPFLNKHFGDYDIIHSHSYIFFSTAQAAIMRMMYKFPLILHLHGGAQTDYSYTTTYSEKLQTIFKKYLFDKSIGKLILKIPDSLISVSQFDLQTILKVFKVKRQNSYWIPNAVDVSKFKIIEDIERKYITFIGRLSYIKGFDLFLKIIEKIHKNNQNIKFLVVGEGSLYRMLQDFKKQIPIKHYHRVPHERMKEIYNQSKILLNTSRYEGMSTTILEAMACGVYIIASKVGGTPEIVKDEKYGYLFEINKLDLASDHCLKIYKNQNMLDKFSKLSRDYVKKQFSWEIITKKIIKIYNSLLE